MTTDCQPLTARQQLIAFFDSLDELPRATVILNTTVHPTAIETARLWAATREDYLVVDGHAGITVFRPDDTVLFSVMRGDM